jgi:hypothetical protein
MAVSMCSHTGGQYCHYGIPLSHSPIIIQNAIPEISDTPLTLISRMGQRGCHMPIYI